jgi:hypothetical protein
VLLIVYFGPLDLVATGFASQHGWQGCLLWMRSGVDRHRPRAAARAANQYVLGVRGHPAGAAISARAIRETTTIRQYQKLYQAHVA